MYLHLGQEYVVKIKDVLGIFDLDTCTISKTTRDFLAEAEKENRVINVTYEIPKSFIVMNDKAKTIYISQIAATTLKKRSGYIDGIKNIK